MVFDHLGGLLGSVGWVLAFDDAAHYSCSVCGSFALCRNTFIPRGVDHATPAPSLPSPYATTPFFLIGIGVAFA